MISIKQQTGKIKGRRLSRKYRRPRAVASGKPKVNLLVSPGRLTDLSETGTNPESAQGTGSSLPISDINQKLAEETVDRPSGGSSLGPEAINNAQAVDVQIASNNASDRLGDEEILAHAF